MATRLRLPLLLLLAGLVALIVAVPRNAVASPSCTGPGHFDQYANINGYSSGACDSGQYCTVGHQWFHWDCVQNPDGTYSPQNVWTESPVFCWCNGGGVGQSGTQMRCC